MKIQRVAVYLGATTPANPVYVEAVKAVGTRLAQMGLTLVFGGSKEGTMTVLADAVTQNGGRAEGIFTRALPEKFLYPRLSETVVTENLAERKAEMYKRADALIALPGSMGTWDELFDALELSKIEMIHGRPSKPIGILNVNGYFDGLVTFFQRSVQEGYTTPACAELLKIGSDIDDLFRKLGIQK